MVGQIWAPGHSRAEEPLAFSCWLAASKTGLWAQPQDGGGFLGHPVLLPTWGIPTYKFRLYGKSRIRILSWLWLRRFDKVPFHLQTALVSSPSTKLSSQGGNPAYGYSVCRFFML
jgi:hypothetical protein